jgi:hypothetical protein
MTNANDSAYPNSAHPYVKGLTKRELLAAMAMQGLISQQTSPTFQIHTEEGVLLVPARKAIPSLAVEYADNLLAELSK